MSLAELPPRASGARKALAALTLRDALTHPRLFAPFFEGDSWATWHATLLAAFGELLTGDERQRFRKVAERQPPSHRVKELVAVVGRGGGKDSIAALIAAFVAVTFEGQHKLRPGERAFVMCIAVDRAQARVAHSYISGFFEQIPALKAMITRIGDESIELNNSVTIEIFPNSYRAVRGRSIICVVADEVAFWRSTETSANPDSEVIGAVSPGLARVPGSMLVLISSAHKRSGVLYQRWKDFYGRDDEDVLVVRGTTLDFNSTFDAREIEKALERDPQLYGAEYLSQWRDDLATFITRDLIDAAVDRGVVVRPPQPGKNYHAFCDPSGGVGDSFTAAIAHREGQNIVVLDALYEKRAPFNPSVATGEIAELIKGYRTVTITGDKYAAQWVVEAFRKCGVTYKQSERDRSQIYLDALPLFTAGRCRLLDNQRMVTQFAALERRTFPNGRDRVDHGISGHDDVANSAAGVMTLAAAKNRLLNITPEILAAVRVPLRARHRQLW
jgi:hypothetical protein